jgi:hypothetical protein
MGLQCLSSKSADIGRRRRASGARLVPAGKGRLRPAQWVAFARHPYRARPARLRPLLLIPSLAAVLSAVGRSQIPIPSRAKQRRNGLEQYDLSIVRLNSDYRSLYLLLVPESQTHGMPSLPLDRHYDMLWPVKTARNGNPLYGINAELDVYHVGRARVGAVLEAGVGGRRYLARSTLKPLDHVLCK